MGEVSLKKNVGWMFIGNSFYAFTQWIQLSLITKFCDTYILGSYTLALAITAPIFMFLGLQLRGLLVTDAKREWNFSSYFSLRFYSMVFALLIVIAYCFLNEQGFCIFLLVALVKLIEGLAEIFNAQQQLYEQMQYVARSLILKGVFATIGIAIGVLLLNSLEYGLLIAFISNAIILIVNDYRNCKLIVEKGNILSFDIKKNKQLIIKALPLGIVMCVISLNTNVSKYITEMFLGTEQQGIYSTIAYCLVIGNFVNGAIGQSFSPRLSKYFLNNNLTEFKNLVKKYLVINFGMGVLLFIGALLGGYYFLQIMFSKEIANYSTLFSIVMFSGIFMYCTSSLGYILTAMRIFKIQPFINIVVLIINTILCLLFIKYWGIYGVVYASIISFSIQGILTFISIKKNYDKKNKGCTSASQP